MTSKEGSQKIQKIEAADPSPAKTYLKRKGTDFPILDAFPDQFGDPHVVVETEIGQCTFPVRSRRVASILQRHHFAKEGEPMSRSDLEGISAVIEAIAQDVPSKTLELRAARQNGAIYYDLASNAGICEITEHGWKTKTNSPVLFRRHPGMLAQVTPCTNGSIDRLLDFFSVKNASDRLLLKVFLVTAFIPDIAHPILAVHGPQGSAKSTMLRMITSLIDPWAINDVPLLDMREFYHAVAHRWVLPLDNLSRITEAYSDLLCKLVTGAGFQKRALYTDDDSVIRSYRRVILLNGVNLPVYKPDLLDRCLLIPLERIPAIKRRDEASIYREFEVAKPSILAGCFDALSKAMALRPSIVLTEPPRLADFGYWGAAVAKALGHTPEEFVYAYKRNEARQNSEALDASPVAVVIAHYLASHSYLKGTPTEILKALTDVSRDAGIDIRMMPKTPRSLGRVIQEIKPNLEAQGYLVLRSRGKSRTICILPPHEPGTLEPELEALKNSFYMPNEEFQETAFASLPSLNNESSLDAKTEEACAPK